MIGQRKHRRGVGRFAGLLLFYLLLVTLSAAPAGAGPGVRLSHGSVAVEARLFTGTSHLLPTMYVSNPGDVTADYRMAAVVVGGVPQPIPGDWLVFLPEAFQLAPGEIEAVDIELVIPGGAPLGHYEGLLAAQLVTSNSDSSWTGAALGAGAAARLEFDVAAPTILQTLLFHLGAMWAAAGVWAWPALSLVALLGLSLWLKRRFRFTIQRR